MVKGSQAKGLEDITTDAPMVIAEASFDASQSLAISLLLSKRNAPLRLTQTSTSPFSSSDKGANSLGS
jgi:hypothetical protein